MNKRHKVPSSTVSIIENDKYLERILLDSEKKGTLFKFYKPLRVFSHVLLELWFGGNKQGCSRRLATNTSEY
jgi:hypothetical protein